MSTSHLQTRTLTDALDRVDTILAARRTRLKETAERQKLASCFSPQSRPEFESWAFAASEYEEVVAVVSKRAPEIIGSLKRPLTDRDFTVVGHCSLDLRFDADPNGAKSVRHTLRDGTAVEGARITSEKAHLYSSGLVSLPTVDGRDVYLFQPAKFGQGNAAQVASAIFESRGNPSRQGLAITFPKARTETLPDYGWVIQLASEDELYVVRNFANSGVAILDENGFFARETQVVQMHPLCISKGRHPVTIDGPFVAFFADDSGVHAAAWFDRDSFTQPGRGLVA